MGFLITFEGIEGCGKTTQMDMVKDHLEWKGKEVVSVREPGGTELGERVRAILLNVHTNDEPIDYFAELFLYEASRAQLLAHIIKPALNEDKVVLCDRFCDSTVAYQGYGRGLDMNAVNQINNYCAAGVLPNLTLVLDCPVEVGLKRAFSRINARNKDAAGKEDRFEKEAIEFHARIRAGYLDLAKKDAARIKVVDGAREIPVIHKEICDIIDRMVK
ncbi:MAG: dTMP kinase [Thermodesulfobacteriota bacterium]